MLGAKELVGLDIGTSSIKMVEIKDSRHGYILSKFGVAPLPPGVIVEGKVVDRAAVVEALKRLQGGLGFKGRGVATCIPSRSVIIKKIILPSMTELELEEQIPYEAEQHIPFPITECFLDYQPLGSPVGQEDQMEVLLVAAKKDYVEDHRALIKEAGLNCIAVDVDVFALENIYEANYELSEEDVVALIDVGAGVMKVNILTAGVTSFSRDVPVGGLAMTEGIQRRWNLTLEEAEGLKQGHLPAGIDPQEVQDFFYNEALALVGEVENSFEFFLATPYGRQVNKIFLSGGAAKTPGLMEITAERTGASVDMLNPFKQIAWDKKVYKPDYLSSMAPLIAGGAGLAVRRRQES